MTRLAYVSNFGEGLEEEEKAAKWLAEEPEEPLPEDLPEEEIKKREDEAAKRAAEETEETQTVAKRKGTKVHLHGENLLKTKALQVRFVTETEPPVAKIAKPIFKNNKMLGLTLPDMGEQLEVGNHMLTVEVSLNGQQFTSNGVKFLYMMVDPALSEEDLRKLEEDEAKTAKKGKKK